MDNIAFEFSTTISTLVSMHAFRLEEDDKLEEDEVFQGAFEIPSIISGRLSAMAADPKVTYIIIKDDDSEFQFVVIATTLTQSLISTQM